MTTRDPITVQPPLLQIVAVPVVRGQTMADRFAAFDAANPHVYRVIEAEALRRARQGEKRIGVKSIYESLRARVDTTGDTYALNNNWPAFYARRLIQRQPQLAALIRTKHAMADEVQS